MPTVLRVGPYRFFFYAYDRREPPHVHVERDAYRAKIWLNPVQLAPPGRFGRREITRIVSLVWEHRQDLLGSWNEFLAN